MKRIHLLLYLLSLLSPFISSAQQVVGTYEMSEFWNSYQVRVDIFEEVTKGKKVPTKLSKMKIYIQVETVGDSRIDTYLKFWPEDALKFASYIANSYIKAQGCLKKDELSGTKIGKGDCEVYLLMRDSAGKLYRRFGWEKGNDFDVIFEQNGTVYPKMLVEGESVRNQGNVKLETDGWRIIFYSAEEVNEFTRLISEAVALTKQK